MSQTDAVSQWWADLTSTKRRAVVRLPITGGLPPGPALDLTENGVVLQRVNARAEHAQVLTAFPDVLREHLARVRNRNRLTQDVGGRTPLTSLSQRTALSNHGELRA